MPRKSFSDVLERPKDPTKKVPLEERIGRTTAKLNASDKQGLRNQVSQIEEEIAAKLEMNKDADVSEMRRDLAHKKMIIQRDDDLTPKSDTARDRLALRAKEIQDLIVPTMCSKKQMWPDSRDPLRMRYVKQNGDWQDRFQSEIHEWQDIQRKLNPDDPGAHSLELIRPDTDTAH